MQPLVAAAAHHTARYQADALRSVSSWLMARIGTMPPLATDRSEAEADRATIKVTSEFDHSSRRCDYAVRRFSSWGRPGARTSCRPATNLAKTGSNPTSDWKDHGTSDQAPSAATNPRRDRDCCQCRHGNTCRAGCGRWQRDARTTIDPDQYWYRRRSQRGTGAITQPASISIEVPSGATVVQVLAYWEGSPQHLRHRRRQYGCLSQGPKSPGR